MRLDHGVHELVAAQNRIGGADVDAQGAADAPVLVNDRDGAWPFNAMGGVERHHRLPSDHRQPLDAFCAARRALVDSRLALGDSLRVARAIRVATARALGLRQCRENFSGEGVAHTASLLPLGLHNGFFHSCFFRRWFD